MGSSKKIGAALWTVQGMLALLFLFAGVMKLVTPLEVMLEQMTLPIPGWFVQCIGVCEVLGALGLVLPSLFRIRPVLTPLAGYGLVLIMVGATLLTAASGPVLAALFPFVVGCLAAFVAYGRWQLAPQRPAAFPRRVRRPGEATRQVLVATR
jgi:uncharacterized membrane protein YphA (DoxX/SURF4 family)